MRHLQRTGRRGRWGLGGSSAGGVLFASDWSTALGSTPNALQDGGRWTRLVECGGGYTSVLAVVEGAALGWSLTPNVLRVTQRGATLCGDLAVKTIEGNTNAGGSRDGWGVFARERNRRGLAFIRVPDRIVSESSSAPASEVAA
jgi:hypothetical protein